MILDELHDSDPILTIGELRGLLATLAWANGHTNHGYTFTLAKLSERADIEKSLHLHFRGGVKRVLIDDLDAWHVPVRKALASWLFQGLDDPGRRPGWYALADEHDRHEVIAKILRMLEGGVKPTRVARVMIEFDGFYECAWDDFAFLGEAGSFFLHLGVSD